MFQAGLNTAISSLGAMRSISRALSDQTMKERAKKYDPINQEFSESRELLTTHRQRLIDTMVRVDQKAHEGRELTPEQQAGTERLFSDWQKITDESNRQLDAELDDIQSRYMNGLISKKRARRLGQEAISLSGQDLAKGAIQIGKDTEEASRRTGIKDIGAYARPEDVARIKLERAQQEKEQMMATRESLSNMGFVFSEERR